MDRQVTYVGSTLLEWHLSKPDQNAMVGLAKLTAAVLGTSGVVNGLACVPTGPASLQVVVQQGEIYQLTSLEATTCGTLPADTTDQIVKQGIQLASVTLPTMPAPGTSGQSINYLIEASYADQDVSVDPTTGNTPVVLQFFNSSNPSTPFSGPNNTGASSNTFRKGVVTLTVKAGAAATTGSQVTPTPDAGTIGLWVVTVANGQTQITAGNIAAYPGAPVITETLTQKISQTTSDGRYGRLAAPNTWSALQTFSAGANFGASGFTALVSSGNPTYQLAPNVYVQWSGSALILNTAAGKYIYIDSGGVFYAPNGASIANGLTVTSGTVSLPTGSVTLSSLNTIGAGTIVGNNTGGSAVPAALTAAQVAAMMPNGSFSNAQLANMAASTLKGNNTGSPAAPSDLTVAQVLALLGLPVKPTWACFGGQGSNGACTINKGSNIASVTRTGAGAYSVAFTSQLADANYAVTITTNSGDVVGSYSAKTTAGFTMSLQVGNANVGQGLSDPTDVSFQVLD